MHGYQQDLSRETVGSFVIISSIYWQQQWAHMRQSASLLGRNSLPTHDHWGHFLAPVMGPHKGISSISQETQWAHS